MFARTVVYQHLMANIMHDDDCEEADILPAVATCIAKLAAMPESMAVTILLRDLEPEDFYNA